MSHRNRAIMFYAAGAAACCLWAATASGQAAAGQAAQQQQTVQSPRIPSGRQPTPAPAQQPKPITNNAVDVGMLFQKSGGSLLRAAFRPPTIPIRQGFRK